MELSTSSDRLDNLEKRIFEVGSEIFSRSQDEEMGLFDKGYWSGKIMEWSMQNPAFKVEMFRFVDVLPSLHSSDQIVDHIKQYFLRPDLELSPLIRAGMGLATWGSLAGKIAASSIRKNVVSMAGQFITGQDSKTAKKTLEKLWNGGFCFTVDILGEAAVAESEAFDYQARYLELVEGLAEDVKGWKAQPDLEAHPLYPVPRANVSVKCSSLYSQIDNLAFRRSVDMIKDRLRPILQAAQKRNVFVNLDMEQNDTRDILLTVTEEIFSEAEFTAYPYFGVVIQAYLKCATQDLARVIECSSRRQTPFTVRLVKGAYWDFEVIQSLQRNWEIPVFTDKAETDANYEVCAKMLLDAYPKIFAAFGSHNVRSLAFAMAYGEKLGLPKTAFETQMLYGMAEPFKKAVKSLGYRVREYAPVGEMLPGMAYLVRRLLENTSNEGFLRAKFVGKAAAETLLMDPRQKIKNKKVQVNNPAMDGARAETANDVAANGGEVLDEENLIMSQFANEPYVDFSLEKTRQALESAAKKWHSEFPIAVEPIIAGRKVSGLPVLEVTNPSRQSETVAKVSLSTKELAEEALTACRKGQKVWAERPVAERAAILNRAAELMVKDKAALTALMTLEVAKSFREADGDVAEAIDFCRYYALEAQRLMKSRSMASTAGEQNRYEYGPRGPAVVIAPWNFPLAILCGMTVGPLVCGNPVIMKPAEQSSAIALKLYEILREAGVPAEVLHLLPGKGEDVGAYLVSHPHIHIINFTGSRAVGLHILEDAAKLKKGQKHIKKVVAEMGGKNALIIDEDADLDEAVVGTLHSAFGFQGQKCSALSRALVHEACYDKFKTRLKEAVLSLKLGEAENGAAKVGPVIDDESQKRLLDVLARNKNKILVQLEVPSDLQGKGHFVPPTIFEENDFQSELGQQEFFGPLLTLFKVKSLDEAIAAANDVDYALTGGIFSRSPQHIEKVRAELEVGNLYINRGITGAVVCKQPFGGYKLSGVGAKAGGPDYLLQFLEPRSVTENTMRRGFAPEI